MRPAREARSLLPWSRRRRGDAPDVCVDRHAPIVQYRDVAELVADLELPVPFDVNELCSAVGKRRGKAIEVMPYPGEVVAKADLADVALPYGLFSPGVHVDGIFYDPRLSSEHREHVILHELGHVVCRHQPAGEEPSEGVLRRATFHDDQERAAESFAYLVAERAHARGGLDAEPVAPEYRDVLGRYAQLED
ncbi:ImmA/IrrE family metallo-endopeptidase [Allokutzneria sp. A3M-2-11 16]|uniref:ImmA/IrrE family metallo-endopeptidase n=1 Tax=Allokutzneria sp. A3M-2-11 16 TaxID=2962043 RepID=UPI0020B647EF|nr:ImmA/IrrE family metallo-endopeptidase [Allokutzneria sp. A3M-2-11 16]MCP3800347.1 ImmA/IrrE family metallo-endopeptidase [Allokutzneria sp. A3M-2-11 16]